MKTIHYFLITLLLLCGIGCGGKKSKLATLQEVDSLIHMSPDSALALLRPLADSMAHESEATRMYYQLLTIKAADKAYITHTSDSLIRQVVAYYEKHPDPTRLPEAYYYAGRVYSDLGDAPQALNYFQRAAESMKGSTDYRFLKVIYSQMGRLFLYQDVYEEAMKVFRQSYQYQVLAGDERGIVVDLNHIGNTFMALDNADSALCYYQKAYKFAQRTNKRELIKMTQKNLSDLYVQLKQYDLARKSLKIFEQSEVEDLISVSSIMADLYFQMGTWDSAAYYYKHLQSFDDIYALQHAHWGLAEIAQHGGNSQSALEHLRLYKVYTDSIREMTRASEVRKMQSLFNYQLREKENRQLEKEVIKQTQSKQRILFLFALLVAGIIICWQFDKLKKHFRKNQARELKSIQMAQYRKSDAFIEENEEKVKQLDKETLKKADPIQQALLQAQKEQLLCQNKQVVADRNEQLLAENAFRKSAIYAKFHAAAHEENPKLPIADWETLREEVDRCYKDFIPRLLALYPFSEMEQRICLLLKTGIKVTGIALLTNRSKSTIVSARKSMYKKVFHQDGKPEEWDDFIRKF